MAVLCHAVQIGHQKVSLVIVKKGFFVKSKVSHLNQDLILRGAIAAVAGWIFVYALGSASTEFMAHKFRAQGELGPYLAKESDFAAPVASIEGVYAKLETCDAALSSIKTLLQPKEKRLKVARDCLAFSDDVLGRAPALSLANLVKALALAEIGLMVDARQALLLSELSAGSNISNAQRRAALWSSQFSDLSPAELDALQRDFVRLAAQDSGTAWLAGQYSKGAGMRIFMTEVIQTLPNARQIAFLDAVRRINE
ncbi:MAG: hypothetical protein EAZ66_04185 [Alphaproteobacteria bacterium]|nr:MAG: hypothetical protein EAZ66_04185 [Alphaproteobacteria bacterium]